MSAPEFVAIGHVVQDLVPGGWRIGGTASFASTQAVRLGLSAGVVTRAAAGLAVGDWLPGVEVVRRASTETTTFENAYDGAGRHQRVPTRASGISEDDVPIEWRKASMVLVGPVCGEIPAEMSGLFPDSSVGVAAQGWLRQVGEDGFVQRRAWAGRPFWRGCRALFVSEEDMAETGADLARWTAEVPVVVVTHHQRGSDVHAEGRSRHIDAIPAREVDATGAGDVYAAAFLVRLCETDDLAEAALFASSAAAWSVESEGLEGIAPRVEIEARLREHPEVALR